MAEEQRAMYPTTTTLTRVRIVQVFAAGAFVLSSLGLANAAEERVDWTRNANVTIRGNVLQKTGGCDGCDDAGAFSRQVIRSGDGYVEFRAADPYHFWFAGLTQPNAGLRFAEIDYAFRFNGNGRADILENGAYQGDADTEVTPSDVFRIAVTRGRVQYFKNGSVIYESQRAPRYPLAFVASLGSSGSRLIDARIEPNGVGRYTSNRGDYFDPNQADSRYDASTFANLDRNRDGVISRYEWTGSVQDFTNLDVNRDNRISRAEMQRGSIDNSNWDSRTFTNLDRNNDGVISRYEWTGSVQDFTNLDVNRDNRISRAEMQRGSIDYSNWDSRTFANLDRNNDGVISRYEWTGNVQDFTDLDVNRDNRISRAEMNRGLQSSSGSIGTSGRQIIVDPRQPWTNTGVRVQAGDMISFDAEGTITMSDNPGDTASPAGSSRTAQNSPLPGRAAGTLLMRIGNSGVVAIGDRQSLRAPASGEVFLGVNDDHLPDNSGEYRVTISVQPR